MELITTEITLTLIQMEMRYGILLELLMTSLIIPTLEQDRSLSLRIRQ